MNTNKKTCIAFSILLGTMAGLAIKLLTVFNIVFSIVKAEFVILNSGSFTETVDGHTYQCFRIENQPSSIAIAWGESPSNATEELVIPSVIASSKPTGSAADYTVVAIAKAGFSRCAFTKITLPQTISEIREEAFAYCQNLTTFQFPKLITRIEPSTFLDCRELLSIYYTSDNDKRALSNKKIEYIGDHAFDSCVKLKKFNCPSKVTYFGESCFQRCNTFTTFKFPYANEDVTNEITIKAYAFADCQYLEKITFDINVTNIDNYSFADTNPALVFHFNGTEEQFESKKYSSLWRNKYITTHSEHNTEVFPVTYNEEKDTSSDEYPGIYYAISQEEQYLDNARRDLIADDEYKTDVKVIKADNNGVVEKYAIITDFNIPEEDSEDYYYDGNLIIPDEITDDNGVTYPVKVIGSNAFSLSVEDQNKIKTITFNKNLVQIQNRAFLGCSSIEALDFSDCENLREISYSIFNEPKLQNKENINPDNFINSEMAAWNQQTYISSLEEIILPNCLEYLGNFAFYNFTNLKTIKFKTDEDEDSSLKVIGDYAFAVHQDYSSDTTYPGTGSIDLVLPYSLSDAEAKKAKVYHSASFDRNNGSGENKSSVHESMKSRWSAINKNAFDNQRGIRTVTMEEKNDGETHETSFATNVFQRCKKLVRFQSNKNLCLIGNNAFGEKNPSLREMFLQADLAKANSIQAANPWGIEDGSTSAKESLFTKGAFKDLVIYIKSSDGKLPNADSKYINETAGSYANELTNRNRTRIPYYFVDWTTPENVKYWHLNKNTDTLLNFGVDGVPKTLAQYKNGFIVMVKNAQEKYTVTNYYTDGNTNNVKDSVDLTSATLTGSSVQIDTIGEEAFGSEATNKGTKYILQDSIATIKERAFYRKTATQGITKITFKSGGSEVVPDGSPSNYCCLPNSVEKIEKNAFYNNKFTTVKLGTELTSIGENAFYSHCNKTDNPTSLYGTITSFAFTDYGSSSENSKLITDGYGIYVKNTNKRFLYQLASGINSNVTIMSGTKGIGYHAAASTKITGVTFNSDNLCTSIFGKAFMNCINLETLTNVSSIKYISTSTQKSAICDGNGAVSIQQEDSSSFYNCKNLKVDFSLMSSLEKIGPSAFRKCTNLANIGLTKTYKFYEYNYDANSGSSTLDSKEETNTNILDLSTLSALKEIGIACFRDIDSIKYVILPNTTGTNYTAESNFSCAGGKNDKPNDNKVFDSGSIKLVGETVHQADQFGNNPTKAKSHYGLAAFDLITLSNYQNVYYRVHSAGDLSSNTNGITYCRYWTAIKTDEANTVKIILFSNYASANHWLTQSSNLSTILHTFFDPAA